MTQPPTPQVICAICSTPGSGRFCSNCGASLEPATCASCGATLSPGARFCHECGRPIGNLTATTAASQGEVAESSPASSLPWIVMAIALVTLLAFLAGSAFKSRRSSALDAPANALPQAGLDDRGTSSGPPEGAVRAPDISQLSPEESADRLYKRVMLLDGEGKTDSVLFFAPMALQSYQMLGPLDMGQRYEMGQIAEVAGAFPLALAQADTILKANPNHLLGLLLAARVAADEKRTIERTSYETRLVAAYPREIAKKLPEYQRHAADIRSAIDAAHAPASKPE